VCSACGITEWLGNPAPLALDHIDGDKTNNILENLRILCYNCHGLTETFCRGNREKKKPKNNVKRCACGKQLQYSNKTGMCLDCYVASGTKTQKLHDSTHLNRDRIDWPSDEDLVKMVKDTNFSATGRALNVSRVAVRERCKRRGLVID
ncbi:HNH endonuclease, partial [Escherichia coli]|nr:HNH endonuclease [Escherichia coli]